MNIVGYEFIEGARFQSGAHKDANEVGKHLELLKEQFKGELTPNDILEDAKNHNSPLHSYFEWDDGKAAEQHRLQQARGLIRTVVAVYRSDEKESVVRHRAYVHIKEGEASHYRETSHAMSQKKTRDNVLQSAWRELQSWKKRYADLEEFASVAEAIDQIKKPEMV
jgi:hypothetical protein